MPSKRKASGKNAQRLAKGISKAETDARLGRARKGALREKSSRHPGRAVAAQRDISPLARFMGALAAEKIRFQLVGMSAAVLQGVLHAAGMGK